MTITLLDPIQKVAQGGRVGSIARQHLVAQRKALWRDDQADHHLTTVETLVAAIAILALVALLAQRVRLEIGAGQIVEQHIELCPKQFAPAFA